MIFLNFFEKKGSDVFSIGPQTGNKLKFINRLSQNLY